MTKEQKVESALATVREARRWHTRDEYVGIIKDIWDGLDSAQTKAIEGPSGIVKDIV